MSSIRPVTWCLLLALCAAPALSLAEGGKGGPDRFDAEQVRDFHHKEIVGSGIEVAATIVTYHKFGSAVDTVFSWAFGDVRRVALMFDSSRPDSDIGRLNAEAATKPVHVNKETIQLLGLAKRVHGLTKGAFDIVTEGTGSARDIKIDKAARTVQFTKPGMQIRLDHVLEGYLADLLLVDLWNANIDNAFVHVGGAARSVGRDMVGPWRLTIADVTGKYAARGISLSFSNLSAATVGSGKRAPAIDFRTKQTLTPACRGATVISRDAATSLAIANAVYTLGPTAGLDLAHKLASRAVIMDTAGNLIKSPGL